jgi:hypothetical protein
MGENQWENNNGRTMGERVLEQIIQRLAEGCQAKKKLQMSVEHENEVFDFFSVCLLFCCLTLLA